ncbi:MULTISPECIES: 4-hydroxy-3-methylbut-2-enyl diphosphate reductase [unclassified Enterococcus]|uniref:4-hydroxy-3-methylbut-2-enyl diphosphate reductase n=1 Tax=unclassified Enterococcus TaxID=2608891 RepID=UPI0015541699|nr:MULTISPECIES: 4-hydroxy-3-methylbut-2-enyl diphosphate reductase [unclassified Enterococcus]MBS7577634.1 4-hydroxy-3-methylbut-2-enyl diphosphate reductase [Enterococcus sp. MMGLQ5-2]MBS7584172.1 4-hydroxy-3-methylbut-2-enyl diphosphate reductase [Enterococcus sp. MMGLQ5-1]NPD12030.1 4-hydroxy-3-methylbut-2-enyl diphosphate reductase [Enterococcus sp. MMGLQ5-1]NPD37467.1 4-hydroxy-3-methylbut-2-enyl diphosphate reductase [Enterococcus sp. MMGLQ5-2]
MKIVNISPRGYCYGVIDAMVIARNVSLSPELPRPIYILGMIVHNKHVTDSFESIGVQTLDGPNRLEILEKIDAGTVIFTAHGVSPQVVKRAKEKGLTIVDASCPDVLITHELVELRLKMGYEIIYIGKKGHPEPEGVIGINPQKIHLISNVAEVENLNLTGNLFLTNQTTMSQWDVDSIMAKVKEKYPSVEIHQDICQATQERQEAVAEQAKGCDLVIVVGDPKSNNTNRLAQVANEQADVPSKRVADISELRSEWFNDVEVVGITAGASTPTPIVREVIKEIHRIAAGEKLTSQVSPEMILPRGKAKALEDKRANRMAYLRKTQLNKD